jgi:hypothetical protein
VSTFEIRKKYGEGQMAHSLAKDQLNQRKENRQLKLPTILSRT